MKTISPTEAAAMIAQMNIKPAVVVEMDDLEWPDDLDDDNLVSTVPESHSISISKESADLQSLLKPKQLTETQIVLEQLREIVFNNQLPKDVSKSSADTCSDRGKVWKLFLSVKSVSAAEYHQFVQRGPSSVHDKIMKDVDRTFKNNLEFHSRVPREQLIRILNAFAWKTAKSPIAGMSFSYVQGMNALAGMFLYVMPELDAFYSFYEFIVNKCPTQVQPNLEGVHANSKLLDSCFKQLDPELHKHLSATLPTETYSIPPLLSFNTCTPPLDEAMLLWDFLLAFGFEFNVLFTISQLTIMRNQLMASNSPIQHVRTMPNLNAAVIIKETLRHFKSIPKERLKELQDTLVKLQ